MLHNFFFAVAQLLTPEKFPSIGECRSHPMMVMMKSLGQNPCRGCYLLPLLRRTLQTTILSLASGLAPPVVERVTWARPVLESQTPSKSGLINSGMLNFALCIQADSPPPSLKIEVLECFISSGLI